MSIYFPGKCNFTSPDVSEFHNIPQIPQQMRTVDRNPPLSLTQICYSSTPSIKTFYALKSVLSDRAIETQDKVNSWDRLSIWTEQLEFTEKKKKISQKQGEVWNQKLQTEKEKNETARKKQVISISD